MTNREKAIRIKDKISEILNIDSELTFFVVRFIEDELKKIDEEEAAE